MEGLVTIKCGEQNEVESKINFTVRLKLTLIFSCPDSNSIKLTSVSIMDDLCNGHRTGNKRAL